MSASAADLLAVDANGNVRPDPLTGWGFRFHSETRKWRRAALQGENNRMPRLVRRSEVAREVGVSESIIKSWEDARLDYLKLHSAPRAEEALAISEKGRVRLDALAPWKLEFFPASRRWRRATAARNELTRAEVAKKLGVGEEVLLRWEDAAMRQIQNSEQGNRPA